MVEVTVTIEHNRRNFLFGKTLAHRFADSFAALDIGFKRCEILFQCGNGSERFTFVVVDNLYEQITVALRDGHAGTRCRSAQVFPNMNFPF